MLTIYHKNAADQLIRTTFDLVTYYCEWRRQWVAYDGNLEPGEDGCYAFYGVGDTRDEAIDAMIVDWEDNYLKI